MVVEQINTLPFFASRYVDVPLLTWFQQLARDVWWHEAPFPLNAAGFALEPLYLSAYRNADVMTISRSSQEDLRRHGVGRRITIFPIAVDMPAIDRVPTLPCEPLRLIFVGRLVSSKRPHDAIRALARVRAQRKATLTLLGRGPDRLVAGLRRLICAEGLDDCADICGFVDESEKTRLLDSSHLLIVPSVKEGWGLVVTEANRRGVPAVAYDVDGLRDAIIDGTTGWLCKPTPESLSDAILNATADEATFQEARVNALQWSQSFSWDRTVAEFEAVLLRAVRAPESAAGRGSPASAR